MQNITHVHIDSDRLDKIGLNAVVLESYISNEFRMAELLFDNYYFKESLLDKTLIKQNGIWYVRLQSTQKIKTTIGLTANAQKVAFTKIRFTTILFEKNRYLALWEV